MGTDNKVLLMNLSPGKYILRVEGLNNNKVWSNNMALMHITVLPPWWQTWQMYMVYIFVIAFILVIVHNIRGKRNRLIGLIRDAEQKAKLQHEIDDQKLKFFTDISHEFRTPLTLLKGAIDQLSEMEFRQKVPSVVKENYELMKRNIGRLMLLIDQVIDLRKLDIGKTKLEVSEDDIVKFIRSAFEDFRIFASQKGLDYKFTSSVPNQIGWFDKDKIDKIISNLLSNAIKYTSVNGKVLLKINFPDEEQKEMASSLNEKIQFSLNDYLAISIINSGDPIPKNDLTRVFERFYKLSKKSYSTRMSTGIGLSLTKELVSLHKGIIYVTSDTILGNCFTFLIPLKKGYYKNELEKEEYGSKDDFVKQHDLFFHLEYENESNNFVSIDDENDQKNDTLPLLLIVEDNSEIRKQITDYFAKWFNIQQSENGLKGFEKAKKLIPDIIISDIMMPVMDGIEFCKNCKNNELTSHIPIVLLTAKSGLNLKITGMDSGADAYISKPFNYGFLKSQLFNLLKNRVLVKKKFSNQNQYLNNILPNKTDISFIDKVNNIINNNLSKEDFNVEALANILGMSSRQVHRKFNGLMNTAPGEYIREYKLKKAAKVLAGDKNITISELAFAVGFKHATNFASAFKKQFGISPKEFQDRGQE